MGVDEGNLSFPHISVLKISELFIYAFYLQEILLCKINFRNEPIDRRVVLYLNDCDCGKSYCREKAAYVLKNHLSKISLKDAAVEFVVE